MAYTIQYCDDYMDSKLDKLGSDYFSLPIKFQHFQQATWDIIRENTKFAEVNQETSDDIHTLVKITYPIMVQYTNELSYYWKALFPDDYHRLISVMPMYLPNNQFNHDVSNSINIDESLLANLLQSEIRIIKLGQEDYFQRSPNKKATSEYPLVIRLEDEVKFNFGIDDGTKYVKAKLVYYSEPVFGDYEESLNNIIVNLPKLTVQKIMDRTCSDLRMKTGDEHAQLNYQFEQTFGKRKS